MQAMREAWTDERLDDLTNRVDEGFVRADARTDRFEDQVDARLAQVDARFDKLEERVDNGFDRMARDMRDLRVELRGEMDTRFGRLESRFDWLQRMMVAGYLTAVLGFIATRA